MIRLFLKVLIILFSLFIFYTPGYSSSDTMLMFVGEDLEVLSIASGREEAAWKAPAVARVITLKDFEKSSYSSVADVLSESAGFHVENFNSGPSVYLRGIPSSALFLYDTVPMGSALSKSGNFFNSNISLASLKRIEVIRGSGSVLWGADAFAGVVNYVPLTGKDFKGSETGVYYSSDDNEKEVFFRQGFEGQKFTSFLSLSAKDIDNSEYKANVKSFFAGENNKPTPASKRFGELSPKDSRLIEMNYNGELKNIFSYSFNISRNEFGYVASDPAEDHTWTENKSSNAGSIKIESKKSIGINSSLRFTGYYTFIDTEHEVIDKDYSSHEDSFFSEIIYDRECFNYSGLLTAGLSYRYSRYNDVPVWLNYVGDFLDEDNDLVLPELLQTDLNNQLWSQFVQYHHDFKGVEFWVGLRNDNHEKYEDKISHNIGVTIPFKDEFIFKIIYGTAYRTPFVKQYSYNNNDNISKYYSGGNELEEISGYTAQFQWSPSEKRLMSITGFINELDNHVVSDRYEGAGISLPNKQTVKGLEFESQWRFNKYFELKGNLTKIFNSGPKETYRYFVLYNDNDQTTIYKDFYHDYDAGPELYWNLSAIFNLRKNIQLIPSLSYYSERKLYFYRENSKKTYESVFTTDLLLKADFNEKLSCTVFAENIFDNKYFAPGYADDVEKGGIHTGFRFSYKW